MSTPVIGSTEPWSGGAVSPHAVCVLAPNPSPITLDGTNTWLLGAPEGPVVIVDPGPADPAHLAAVRAQVHRAGQRVTEILLSHGHADHSAAAADFAAAFAAPVRALDPAHRLGAEGLGDGDHVSAGDVNVRVVATPGHTSDSLSFVLEPDRAVLTGDTVLGRGTTLVAWPDGTLTDYLASLRRLRRLADQWSLARVLPGHGPALDRPADLFDEYLAHRHERLAQVRAVIEGGASSVFDVVDAVYEPLPPGVRPAALASAAAQWTYLTGRDPW